MTLKDKLTAEPGFQYVVDSLELMSAAGRRRMLSQGFLTDADSLNAELDRVGRIVSCLSDDVVDFVPECQCGEGGVDQSLKHSSNQTLSAEPTAHHKQSITHLRHQLMQMHDLQGTMNNLRQHVCLEEVELFEIKSFALLCKETMRAATDMGVADILAIPDTKEVFDLLDPDGTGLPNFYVYDSYHPDLGELRRELKALQTKQHGSALHHGSALLSAEQKEEDALDLQRRINDLFDRQSQIQQQVIAQLSDKLVAHQPMLQQAYDRMAYTDFLFAKATLAQRWQLVRPEINPSSNHSSHLIQIWNPRLKHRNEELGLRYQPVDIKLQSGTCLITGANMAGKTVLLKTVGIVQMMAQFGFFVPAERASVTLVDDVVFCIGDEQNEMNGLSSFASEIIKISDALSRAEKEHLLLLIDEPARTTNPIEGKAIVQAVADLLDRCTSMTLITTHYSQLGLSCRRLRVRGFVESAATERLTPDNINRFIDYSLLPDDSDDVPQEAMRIASILQCNSALLAKAQEYLG